MMKILLLGIQTKVLDEGAKNIATNLSQALALHCEILMLHQRQVLLPKNLFKCRKFSPDLILTVHGPSTKTAYLTTLLKLVCRQAPVAMIATQPHGDQRLLKLLSMLGIDLVFAQSNHWHQALENSHIAVEMLPNGVDTTKFHPTGPGDDIEQLKSELGIDPNVKLALHIGPVNHNRGLELLIELQAEADWQVLVIGSKTAPYVNKLAERLKKAGIIVCNRYFPDISMVYCAADAYIFPVFDRSGSIEYPLTVLEAMACDRPVLSTPFRGLPDLLPSAPAVRFFNDYSDLQTKLKEVVGESGNRSSVLDLDWKNIATQFLKSIDKRLGIS